LTSRTDRGSRPPSDVRGSRSLQRALAPKAWDRRLVALGIVAVLVGSVLAAGVRSAGGSVSVEEVRFAGSDGMLLSAHLYVPDTATNESPAPGILAIHGYINARETQQAFATELARRGYVVLALDQPGHGYSDPPAFAHGFGGPDGLAHLRSLPFVDPDNIGLEGHSMGGWAVQIAAGVTPDAYRSMVILGSSPGTFGAPEGTPEFPRNLAVVYAQYDEFSSLMWETPVAAEVAQSAKMQELFGTDGPVEPGQVYGSIEEGTARVLHTPATIHPGNHLDVRSVGYAIDWFDRTLEGATPTPADDQIWPWTELGTTLILLGMLVLIVPVASLLGGRWAATVGPKGTEPGAHDVPAAARWITIATLTVIPVVTYFWLNNLGAELIEPNWLWRQEITNGLMTWAVVNGVIAVIIGAIVIKALKVDDPMPTAAVSGRTVGASLVVALATVLVLHVLLSVIADWFSVDGRFWVLALKPMSPQQVLQFLAYLIPFTAFFVVFSATFGGLLRRTGRGEAWVHGLIAAAGFALFLLVQYVSLLTTGTAAFPDEPLLTIVAFQVVFLLFVAGVVVSALHRRFGQPYLGGFVVGVFVTWYVVAGQATHYV
jgi:pimeloyl-ACP methyl ester carboxylesterase